MTIPHLEEYQDLMRRTHILESGHDIRTIQELLGHADVNTTMIYTHMAKKNFLGVTSPLDSLETRESE